MSPTRVITPEVSEKVADAVAYVLSQADDFPSLITELVIAGSNLPNVCIDWHSRRLIEAEEALDGLRNISMGMHTTQSATLGPTPGNWSKDSLAVGYVSRRRDVNHSAGF